MTSETRTTVAAACAALLILVPVSAVAAVPGTTGWSTDAVAADGPRALDAPAAQSDVDPDVVLLRVSVAEDGTAHWEVQYRVRLDDENATAAFESVQADIEENASAYTEEFATGMQGTVDAAQAETGREMALENVTVTAERERLPQEYGVITYRFRWTNFAVVDGERVRAGDALSGFYLDSESSLAFDWPGGYETESVAPDPDERGNGSVTWHGPTDFGPNEPRVVLAPAGGDGGLDGGLFAALGIAAVLALVGGAWVVAARTGLGRGEGPIPNAPTAGAAEGGDDAADESPEPPEELLSNEERVLRLLDERGGRVKQQEIAAEFDWTDAKTSQVVGTLRDEDEVETFRIGRENVVALPEESDF